MKDGMTRYPKLITDLPRAEIPIEGVRAWLSQGTDHQVVFFDIDPIGEIPRHTHGEQWGVVVEGEMELSICGEVRRYGPGDSYHIPAGVEHGARFLSRFRAIDVFADRDRYRASSHPAGGSQRWPAGSECGKDCAAPARLREDER